MSPAEMAHLHRAAFLQDRPWSAREFQELLERPGCFCLGDRNAFLLGSLIADEAEILTIATDPAHQRQGMARALVDQCLTETKAKGGKQVFLEVAADNAPAMALYKSCGFEEAGRRRDYYHRADGSRADAIVMARSLA